MLKRKSQSDGAGDARSADGLTGLPGRAQLVPWLEDGIAKARATSKRTALIFVGVGNLRDVNDTHGPDTGDRVLLEVGQRLEEAFGESARIARYSGAEFAAVVSDVETADRLKQMGTELLGLINVPFDSDGAEIPVFTNLGAALSDTGYAGADSWMQDAHGALIQARDEGVGAVVIHDESTRNRIDTQITDDRVRNAFENEEFVVVYQPIVTPSTGQVVGFESLLRWLDPSSGVGLIPPGQFLPLLEKTGLIAPVGTWILGTATSQVKTWNDRRPSDKPLFVSVNLGAKQIAHGSFADSVASALDQSGLPPELLTLDVTPEAITYNKHATWGALRDLKGLGVRVALDDFGVGDSTLAYLREMSIDLLRIDRMFVEGLGRTREDTAIVSHLIGLGRDLAILTLAEGVETAEQAAKLNEMNCPLAQGWYFGKPEPDFEIETKLFPKSRS